MGLIEMIRAKAQSDKKTIVLPEGDEIRTVEAAAIIRAEELAVPVLLGKTESVLAAAEKVGVSAPYVSQLVAKYFAGGIEAIAGNHYGGNRRNKSVEEEELEQSY